MSAVVLVSGTVRVVKPLSKRGTNDVFGFAVSVLTEAKDVLGETLEVTVFNPRNGEAPVRHLIGDHVVWVVEVESTSFGLRGTYRGEGGSSPALPSYPAPVKVAEPAK